VNFSLPVRYPDDAMNKRNPWASVGRQGKAVGYAPTGRRLCCLIAATRYFFPSSSGSFATLAAIRRASSLVENYKAVYCVGFKSL
jgi:hypothetical protein